MSNIIKGAQEYPMEDLYHSVLCHDRRDEEGTVP